MKYIYNFSRHEDEIDLCCLEMRALFGCESNSTVLESDTEVEPSRSPFIKERLTVIFEAESFAELATLVRGFQVTQTFKVIYIHLDSDQKLPFEKRRELAREIGLRIQGSVDLDKPERRFCITKLNKRWLFGEYDESEPIWHKHQQKPNQYSTALSTRVARAVVNIAVPNPKGIKAIDPCCGIGTVLIEARSMGIDIVGSDLNPLILPATRENLAFFELEAEVTKKDIRCVTGYYDVAIIDMPYNLCSVLDPKVQLEMLESARKFAEKAVIVTVEQIDPLIEKAGFTIVDRCEARKSRFSRQVIICI